MDEDSFAFGAFRLIPSERILFVDGKPLRLGSRALDILVGLVERAGETISKEELIARAWPDTVVEESALRVHIAALRKALGDGRNGKRYIANHLGRGYAFVSPVIRENAPSAPAPSNDSAEGDHLPASLTRIVGRDHTISRLTNQLARHRFLTIVGPGGIGKTTVAVAVANRARATYKDGAWFVGLASLSDPDLVASAVGAELGVQAWGGNHAEALAAWLRNKTALLVLDSCEHVIGAAASLAELLLKAAPGTSILTTSRESLRAEGETLHRLAPLELPSDPVDLAAEALRYSAVQLFNERATAAMDEFVLGDSDVPAILEICRRLDGIPLALELAAARVGVFGIRDLAAHLDDRFRLLTAGRRTALPRHQTLRATLDWSFELLPEPERVILRRLAIFAGGFRLEAASAVVASPELASSEVVEGFANLVAKSLVAAEIDARGARYRLLDTTRAYALEKLGEAGEREQLARRHAEYYRDRFEQAEAELEARSTAEWPVAYGRRIDNLSAALDWAFSRNGDSTIGVALTLAAVPLWMHLSLLDECRSRVEQALAALGAGASRDARRETKLHAALGASLIYTRGATGAETSAAWTKALMLAESLEDAEYQLHALWGLWFFHTAVGRHSVALELAQRFYTLATNQSDSNHRLVAERLIGISQFYLGDLMGARRHIERDVVDYFGSLNIRFPVDPRIAARVFLAWILWLQGFPDQAIRTAESSIEDARVTNHALTLCYALALAGCPIALLVGDLAAAEHYTGTLLDHSSRYALARWRAFGRGHQGVLAIKRGDVATGLPLLRAGFDELGRANFAVMRLIAFVMTEALVPAGQISEGLAAVKEEIVQSEHTEGRSLVAGLLRVEGELLLLQGAPEAAAAAEDHFRQALDWARRQGALSWELRAATSLARLLRDQGRSANASALLQPIYDRFTEGFDTADLKSARALLDTLRPR